MLSFASICPHPPIIIPTIGSENDLKKVKNTIEAMKKLEGILRNIHPETLIIISPHGPVGFKELSIMEGEVFIGNFSMFGDYKTNLNFEEDTKIKSDLIKTCEEENILYRVCDKKKLDHGCLVPLFYLAQKIKPKILPLSYSLLDLGWNFKYGNLLGRVIQKSRKKIGVIASGDLSHHLLPNAPAGYSPRGKEFDEKIVEALKKNDIKGILNIDEELSEEAGECGLRSIAILLGILSELKVSNLEFRILSYEGPFGVGYLVANVEGIAGS